MRSKWNLWQEMTTDTSSADTMNKNWFGRDQPLTNLPIGPSQPAHLSIVMVPASEKESPVSDPASMHYRHFPEEINKHHKITSQ